MSPVKVVVLAVLVGIGFWMALVAASLADDCPGLFLNLGTELMGGVAIYFILDHVIGSRERRETEERELQAHKKDLIARMSSRVHDVAIAAAEELGRRGWLKDGTLKGVRLLDARLEGVQLIEAKLQGAILINASLQRAQLSFADLQGAQLFLADLQGAILIGTNFKGADLREANLEKATLPLVAGFDEKTRLPDWAWWTPHTDMARFTDPQHPQFWRSDVPISPAYKPSGTE